MAGKYNVRHFRGRSHYPERLEARELSHSPVMPDLDALRSWASKLSESEQERRAVLTRRQMKRDLRIEHRGHHEFVELVSPR